MIIGHAIKKESKPIVATIDADFIPFYVCHNKKNQPVKSLEDCLNQCDNFIENINKSIESDYYIGYLTIGKCFRYQVNSDYKAKRKYTDLPPYTSEVRQHLIDKHNFKGIEKYEADDCVMSFKKQYSNEYDIVITSPDKDILMIEGTHFNPKTMSFHTTTDYEANYYFWQSMITGDVTDNIKGLPRKGKKYWENITEEYVGIGYHTLVLDSYIDHFGEYEGIKEFYKNYYSLKLVDNVTLGEIKLNRTKGVIGEQTEISREE